MNAENTAFLLQAGPTLYRPGDPREPFALFSFECGDGWFQLLYDLTVRLETHTWFQNVLPDQRVRAVQVKEKFGTLCFYIDNGTEQMFAMIHEAEGRSAHICETCGEPGTTKGSGWLRTTCEEHAQ